MTDDLPPLDYASPSRPLVLKPDWITWLAAVGWIPPLAMVSYPLLRYGIYPAFVAVVWTIVLVLEARSLLGQSPWTALLLAAGYALISLPLLLVFFTGGPWQLNMTVAACVAYLWLLAAGHVRWLQIIDAHSELLKQFQLKGARSHLSPLSPGQLGDEKPDSDL